MPVPILFYTQGDYPLTNNFSLRRIPNVSSI